MIKTEKRYCNICRKECEYKVLSDEDNLFVAWGSSHVVAWGSSHVVAWDGSHVEAWGSSHVVAWGSSHVVARGSSHVEARDSSHVEAWDGSHVVARGSSHVVASGPYTTTIIKSKDAKVQGGTLIGNSIISAKQWLEKCGVPIKREYAILFKSVKKDFTTQNGISFKPHTKHEAPDWDANFTEECGRGIHYCPTVAQARTFRDEGVYVACRVKVSDMADLPVFAQYPDKIRAKGGYTLYEVDEDGKRKTRKVKKEQANGHSD